MPGPAPAASFVAADREALARRVRLVEVVPESGRRLAFSVALVRMVAAERPAVAVLWFAAPGYGTVTAAVCRAARVPLVVISGGADVAAIPAIGFGEARPGWRRRAVRWILEGAAEVWAFSASAAAEIAAVAPGSTVRVVPPAVDTAFFRPSPDAAGPGRGLAREPLVVSTCAAITPVTIAQKGLDRLVAAARLLPEVAFAITGAPADDPAVAAFVSAAPSNVAFAGLVPRAALRDLYARAAVVAQLSRHEGFGVAAVEAAAMGCRVVTTRLPVFAEVLGPAADLVALDAPADAVAAALREALAAPSPADGWAGLDRRYGGAVREAAWAGWLASSF